MDIAATTEGLKTRYIERVPTLRASVIPDAVDLARSGSLIVIDVDGVGHVPAFQIKDGRPRPEIARVLAALPEGMRSGWGAAFWFASGSQRLRCSPQEAIINPVRVDEVVDLARRSGTVVG